MKTKILFLAAFGIFAIANSSLAANTHPAGTLVNSTGTIYRVSEDGSALEGFESPAKFLSHYYKFTDAVPINSADNALPKTGLVPWGDGRIFNDNNTIFQVADGIKYGFPSQEIFESYGYNFGQAANAAVNIFQSLTVNSKDFGHVNGTFVNNNGTVWLIEPNVRYAVSEPGILYSWGRTFADVVPANARDMQKEDVGLLGFRVGSVINDTGTISIITQNGKQSFPTAECFTNFGYNFSKVIVGKTSMYQSLGLICGPEPSSKYTRTTVKTSRGDFIADVMTFNLNDVKVVTDTANLSDCITNCPTKSLMSYVTDNGGFAGINGTYFCPTDYPDCASKTNSFYWKVYNSRLGVMINASNGIKEDVPFIGFNGFNATYYSTYKNFKDSNAMITAGINHEPALVSGGQVVLNENLIDNKEKTAKSNRGSLGLKGQTVYAVIAKSATVPDLAAIMQTLGVDSAINLDGGGSSSMIFDNAYKVGPGRNLPNAIVFVKR